MKMVPNRDRRFGSAKVYWLSWINGRPYLFTDSDLDRAAARAAANPEDVAPRSLLGRISDWLRPAP